MQRNTSCGTFLDGDDDLIEDGVEAGGLDNNDFGKPLWERNGGRIESLEYLSTADNKYGPSDILETCESSRLLDLANGDVGCCTPYGGYGNPSPLALMVSVWPKFILGADCFSNVRSRCGKLSARFCFNSFLNGDRPNKSAFGIKLRGGGGAAFEFVA